jgi:hypothetical protein
MSTWGWALLLKPLIYAAFFVLVIAPLVWALNKLIPMSRLKVLLFKVRSGNGATRRDKGIMIAGVLCAYAFLALLIAFLSHG